MLLIKTTKFLIYKIYSDIWLQFLQFWEEVSSCSEANQSNLTCIVPEKWNLLYNGLIKTYPFTSHLGLEMWKEFKGHVSWLFEKEREETLASTLENSNKSISEIKLSLMFWKGDLYLRWNNWAKPLDEYIA